MFSLEEIKQIVRAEVETLAGSAVEGDDQSIFKDGYLDSLNILHIITFIEAQFSIPIDPFSINLDTLGSINRAAEYIQSKLGS